MVARRTGIYPELMCLVRNCHKKILASWRTPVPFLCLIKYVIPLSFAYAHLQQGERAADAPRSPNLPELAGPRPSEPQLRRAHAYRSLLAHHYVIEQFYIHQRRALIQPARY